MRTTSYQRCGVTHDTLTLPTSRGGTREKTASTTRRQHSQGETGITWEQAGPLAVWGLKRRLTGLAPATTCACMVWRRNILIPLRLVFMSIYQGICWASAPSQQGYSCPWASRWKRTRAAHHQAGPGCPCAEAQAPRATTWSEPCYVNSSGGRGPGLPALAFLALPSRHPEQLFKLIEWAF